MRKVDRLRETLEETLAATEQDGSHNDCELVYVPSGESLADNL